MADSTAKGDAFASVLEGFDQRRRRALAMGDPRRLQERRAAGVLNARERLECLLDAGSFVESGLFATSARAEMRDRTPADGKVAGFGTIGGRHVAVVSNDFTVLGASSAQVNGKKVRHVKQVATGRGLPVVFFGESSGARMPDRMGASGRAILGQDPIEYQRLRETPWVSALLGHCYGSSTWYAAMSDFVVMRKGATMAVASPRVISLAISQPVSGEELGGWRLHTERSGLVDHAVDSDQEAIDLVKRFLSYLPSHHLEPPPQAPVPPGSETAARKVIDLVPESRTEVYDMRKVVATITDAGSVLELKPSFGRSITTALARLGGATVGVLANNPLFKGGAIDVDACRKAIAFMVLCDSFNVPMVILVDVPGFLIGVEGELRGAPGHIVNWMNALSLCSVPKLSVIIRKSYGQAYLNMGGGRNSDEVACWPMADLGFMDPRTAVHVLYGLREDEDPTRYRQLLEDISRDSSAWDLAGLYEAQTVIDPRETRDYLLRALELHRLRLKHGVGEHLLRNWPTSY